jgi:hypothetical protein
MPTAEMFWQMKEYGNIDTEGRFELHYEWGGADPEYTLGGNVIYNVDPVDNRSKMTVRPSIFFVTTGYNAFEATQYSNSLHDLIGRRTIGMNKGLTWVLNYETFASQGSSTELAAVENNVLDIDQLLLANVGAGTWAQNSIKLRNYPANVSNRINSIPYFIRPHIMGHDIQGIHTDTNLFWRSPVYQCSGGQGNPTLPSDAYIDTGQTDPKLKDILVRDSIDGYSTEFPLHQDIDYVCDQMQTGNMFTLMGVTSTAGLSYLRRNLYNYTQAFVSEPLHDFGINYVDYVKHSGKNLVFYADPIMDRLWPNAIFFFDPMMIPLMCVQDWGPMIQMWQYLPQTLGTYATAKVIWGQRFLKDSQAVAALLNCRWY